MNSLRKNKKRTFEELVMENKQQLLQDQAALERIEDRWEQRMLKKLD
ncbi:FbpB family small basic protein [Metabacillus sediminilitoris]